MNFIIYVMMFIVVYLIYYVFVISRKNVLNKFKNGKELTYLKYKYKIKVNNKNLKKLANTVVLGNSFIISTTLFIISYIDNFFVKLLVLMISILVLILGVYHIIGKYYQKQEG